VDVEHPELKTSLTYPGVSCRVDENSYRVRRRAPLIGEHNRDIFQRELGLSDNDFITLKSRRII
jgi:crotonobetainyl-CoA:carnitine CoA-transferase CaiB-like acyl-CoA transferase